MLDFRSFGVDIHVWSWSDRSILTMLIDIVEEREKTVEVFLGNRIIFVVVAARAVHGHPEPYR